VGVEEHMNTVQELATYIYEQLALAEEIREGCHQGGNTNGAVIQLARIVTLKQVLKRVNELIHNGVTYSTNAPSLDHDDGV
jgi:hypothetical protein